MKYPTEILDEIRARLPVSHVVARKVQLKKAGREFRGLSPFKIEKTPSFFVNDQKGFYHCFASGEHGDIFTFLIKTEGLSFPEAVERLAAEAGVTLPKPRKTDPEREDRRARLYNLLEASARFFEDMLAGELGQEARRYLDRRGLERRTISDFRIGYAPNDRHALTKHLRSLGFGEDLIAEAGMLINGPDIPTPYDRFRNRVMFPIMDLKKRVIAFGGRALDPDQPAKYLNSPETPLFHKGALLFNYATARPLAYERKQIIVVEGYMDVIALSESGFGETVAPLGTALTLDQLTLLWRVSDEPVLCFDGDQAGQKAAYRAIDTMLPALKPGASAVFAFLPEGLDPDDVIRQQGADALRSLLKSARPLVDVLFEREWRSGDWSTPERRARLEQQINQLVARIENRTVRNHYERAMRDRLFAAWGSRFRQWQGVAPSGGAHTGRRGHLERDTAYSQRKGPRVANNPQKRQTGPFAGYGQLKDCAQVRAKGDNPLNREALLLKTLINHPWLLEQQTEEIAAISFTTPAFERVRDGLLAELSDDKPLDSLTLRSQLEKASLSKDLDLVERTLTHNSDKFAAPEADPNEVRAGWRHILALHHRFGLEQELLSVEREYREDLSEEAFERIRELKALLARTEALEIPSEI